MNKNVIAKRVRRRIIEMIHEAKSGHPGGSLSCVEILVELYSDWLGDDDCFMLSKGHACPALYAVLEELRGMPKYKLRALGSPYQGHPSVTHLSEVETSTGSLGQGFSFAMGRALGKKLQGKPGTVYVLLGDGELQEGQVWEAAMFAAQHKLGNLCAIVDYNKLQSDDCNSNIIGLEPLAEKWRAFGWDCVSVDGHDFAALETYITFSNHPFFEDMPFTIIANTTKGKGVPYMEGSPAWHGSVELTDEQLEEALCKLS